MCVKWCDLNPSLIFLNLSLQSHSWVDGLFCFSQAHLAQRQKKKICLWALAQCFFISSPLPWELMTWKEEVFLIWLKWDVSLHKLRISKTFHWKQQRLNIFMLCEEARQKKKRKICSNSSCQKYDCAHPGGNTSFFTPLLAPRIVMAIFSLI